jgi:hypothetical protein
MKSKKNTTVLMTVLAVVVALAVPALSQEKPADNMQILREKARADKKRLVAKHMKLTESEAKAFWPVYDSYQETLRKLDDRLLKVIKNYAENYDSLSDKDAKEIREEYMAIERERLRLLESYLPKFGKALPEKKVFRYLQVERTWQAAAEAMLANNIPLIQ